MKSFLGIIFPIMMIAQTFVPDYRNGNPNALVCPDDKPCFQCDHVKAKRYEKLHDKQLWHGDIWYLPLDKEP